MWLEGEGSPQAVAALGRLADSDPKALAALEKRSSIDVNTYIAAWEAVTRNAALGNDVPAFGARRSDARGRRGDGACRGAIRGSSRSCPISRARWFDCRRDIAAASSPACSRASVPARTRTCERRLIDAKTRGAMCDGIGLPEASGDAKSLVLAVPPEGRDHASCVDVVLTMATTEDVVLDWLAVSAEPGLITATAKSTLPCARLGVIWAKGLVERPPETHSALTVPLQLSLRRCATALDPVMADLLDEGAARTCVYHASNRSVLERALRSEAHVPSAARRLGRERITANPRARARRARPRLLVRSLT